MSDPRKTRNILSLGLIALLAAALLLLVLADRRSSERVVRENARAAAQAQADALQRQAAGEEIYAALLRDVGAALPGIVCWGDECTVGTARGALPGRLAKVLAEDLFSGVEDAFYRSAGLSNTGELRIAVVDQGVAGEGMAEIMARTGAGTMLLAEDHLIDAVPAARDLPLVDAEGHTLLFAEQENAGFGLATINGIEGYLYTGSYNYDGVHTVLAFERSAAGQTVLAPQGTPVYTEGSQLYRDYLPVLFFSERGDVDAATFAKDLEKIVSLYGDGACAVVCATAQGSQTDLLLTQAFGTRYIRCEKALGELLDADFQFLAEQTYAVLRAQGVFGSIETAVEAAEGALSALKDGGAAAATTST